MLFDAATSAIAGNKIRLAMRVGSPLLPGWVTDKDGTPIMEEKPVFDREDFYQAPLGGTREQGSHNGYGFAMMAEVLSTFLAGALPTMLNPAQRLQEPVAAYDIKAFHRPRRAASAIGLVPSRGFAPKVGTTCRPAAVKQTPTMSSCAACIAKWPIAPKCPLL